jgi:FAD-dependent urate hydroxylase
MKAIVIGAGIGGLCAAIALRDAALDVSIYERVSQIREVGAGLSLWPNAIKAFDKLGLGTALRGISIPQIDGGIHDWRGGLITGSSTHFLETHFGASIIMAHRAELLAMLMDAAKDIPTHTNMHFKSYEQDTSGVTANFENGERARADILIGADGIKSLLRKQMFTADTSPRYSGYTAWRAVTHFDYPSDSTYWGEVWGCGLRFGLAPMSNQRVYWFAVQNAPENTPPPAQGHKAHLLDLFGQLHHPIPELLASTDESVILNNPIYDIAPLDHWVDGRVALLGDAAHAMTPNLGQGACQAIEDAVALKTAFESTSDIKAAFTLYQTKRLKRANGIVTQSRRIGQVGQIQNPIACWLRDFAFKHLPASMRDRQIESVVSYEV